MSIFSIFDPGALGDDIALEGGNLAVNDHYDVQELLDVDNVLASIPRRLNTSKGSVAVIIEDVTGLKLLKGDLGNDVFRLRSEPGTDANLSALRAGIVECMQQDDRLSVVDVRLQFGVVQGFSVPIFDIDFEIDGGSRQTTSVFQNPLTKEFELV